MVSILISPAYATLNSSQPHLETQWLASVPYFPNLRSGYLHEAKSGNVDVPGYSAKSPAGEHLSGQKVNQETSG